MALALAVTACAADPASHVGAGAQAVVYGSDDRREVYEYAPDHWARAVAESSLVAIGHAREIRVEANQATLHAPSARERFGLCPEEPFGDQPAFALCTGIAVTSSLVLTAAHCLRAGTPEELVALGRYYYEAPGELSALRAADVHVISAVLQRDDVADYAWLRLSDAVLTTVPFQSELPQPDAPVVAVAHGAGLPAKIDAGSQAFAGDVRSFLTTLDAFGGASGGPVFSSDGTLLGILTTGSPDYVPAEQNCLTAVHIPDLPSYASELVIGIGEAVLGLCRAQPDVELCPPQHGAGPVVDRPRAEHATSCSLAPRPRGRGEPHATLLLIVLAIAARWARRPRHTRRGS